MTPKKPPMEDHLVPTAKDLDTFVEDMDLDVKSPKAAATPKPVAADTADCEAFCSTAAVNLHLRLLQEEQGVVEGDDEPAHRG